LLLRASLAATEFLTEFLVSPKLPRVFLWFYRNTEMFSIS
jgi:hypothetical protein